mgnify:CR=1 FL=1
MKRIAFLLGAAIVVDDKVAALSVLGFGSAVPR